MALENHRGVVRGLIAMLIVVEFICENKSYEVMNTPFVAKYVPGT